MRRRGHLTSSRSPSGSTRSRNGEAGVGKTRRSRFAKYRFARLSSSALFSLDANSTHRVDVDAGTPTHRRRRRRSNGRRPPVAESEDRAVSRVRSAISQVRSSHRRRNPAYAPTPSTPVHGCQPTPRPAFCFVCWTTSVHGRENLLFLSFFILFPRQLCSRGGERKGPAPGASRGRCRHRRARPEARRRPTQGCAGRRRHGPRRRQSAARRRELEALGVSGAREKYTNEGEKTLHCFPYRFLGAPVVVFRWREEAGEVAPLRDGGVDRRDLSARSERDRISCMGLDLDLGLG